MPRATQITKYLCYELENLESSDADVVEALSAEYAAAEYAETSDYENGEIVDEQIIMVKEEGSDIWQKYTVSMEMLPFYSAELCEDTVDKSVTKQWRERIKADRRSWESISKADLLSILKEAEPTLTDRKSVVNKGMTKRQVHGIMAAAEPEINEQGRGYFLVARNIVREFVVGRKRI